MMKRTTCLLSTLVCLTFAWSNLGYAEPQSWKVKPGDALSVIAEHFGVTVEEIKRWNQLDSDLILIGQELIIDKEHLKPKTQSKADEIPTEEYEIRYGDTLSSIAVNFDTSITALLEANPNLEADRIWAGQKLRIVDPRPLVSFTIQPGDTLAMIAARHGVETGDLIRWNPYLDELKTYHGTQIRLHSSIPISPSLSIGAVNQGTLVRGEQLSPHNNYIIRDPKRAYGTVETVRWVRAAFDRVANRYSKTKRVRIHDISKEGGGWLNDHKSHQSGRDVDIGYFRWKCPEGNCAYEKTSAIELDTLRHWTLLEYWLKQGVIEVTFMDYQLQAQLYKRAKEKGASEEQLQKWFQYPRGRNATQGLIRHWKGHDDHMHVRFVCPLSDPECE